MLHEKSPEVRRETERSDPGELEGVRPLGIKCVQRKPLNMLHEKSPVLPDFFVEHRGVEPLTSRLRTWRSTN